MAIGTGKENCFYFWGFFFFFGFSRNLGMFKITKAIKSMAFHLQSTFSVQIQCIYNTWTTPETKT